MVKSCYIHIPFCKNICSYCDFCKMFYHKEMVREYLNALEKEINQFYQKEELETIYIGGGTPSALEIDELKRLFSILGKLKRKENAEVTIEGNFESTTKEKLELYQSFGVNRLSFGIETTSSKHLRYLNRELSKEQVEEVIHSARKMGFQNINVDLIYALKEETIKTLEKDIDFILSLGVDHISTYSLMIEPHTILKINKEVPISEELDEEMYQWICKKLKESGYNHYEISNFCLEGKQSKHNMTYWHNEEYYGFGLGASSYLNNNRETTTRSYTNYVKGKYHKEVEVLSKEDKMFYEVICHMRLKEGIYLPSFKEKYGMNLQDIFPFQDLIQENLLVESENSLQIPEEKWYISNEILVRWLG